MTENIEMKLMNISRMSEKKLMDNSGTLEKKWKENSKISKDELSDSSWSRNGKEIHELKKKNWHRIWKFWMITSQKLL